MMKGSNGARTAISLAVFSALTIGATISAVPVASAYTASSDAIIGTGRTKASTDAIIGTGRRVDSDAIIGTGRRASSDAIIGTGRTASSDAIIGTGRQKLVWRGPVQSVDRKLGTITVLEKTFQIPPNDTIVDDLANLVASGTQVQVAVVGAAQKGGTIDQARLYVLDDGYVPGVSPIAITGTISKIDASTGHILVGKTLVDMNMLSTEALSLIKAGDTITVLGLLPQVGQPALATEIQNR